jgi:hypothetical protein
VFPKINVKDTDDAPSADTANVNSDGAATTNAAADTNGNVNGATNTPTP